MASHSILFRGNSVDGWFGAFIMRKVMINHTPCTLYAIAANLPHTWPSSKLLANTHITLIEVNVPTSTHQIWLKGGALSVNWIDRYNSSHADITYDNDVCVSQRIFKTLLPQLSYPPWLYIVDRLTRWVNVTDYDRSIREMLDPIIHLPPLHRMDEAILHTEQFFAIMNSPSDAAALVQKGKVLLNTKDAALVPILTRGTLHTLTPENVIAWGLSSHWVGLNVFILNNTGYTIDTNEASHLAFLQYPGLHVFINYRRKPVSGKNHIIYSARSREFNLLADNGIFKGHPTSAGASISTDDAMVLPFL
jgi:hypothetical protein